MEYIDIFDENNTLIGKVKEKQQAHEDGDFHRTAHVWIINNKNEKSIFGIILLICSTTGYILEVRKNKKKKNE